MVEQLSNFLKYHTFVFVAVVASLVYVEHKCLHIQYLCIQYVIERREQKI